MNCVTRIKNMYATFSVTDKKVADYIIKNSKKISHLSIQEAAKGANTSTATFLRFCRKIGYDGFSAFKIALLESEVTSPVEDYNQMILESDSLTTMGEKLTLSMKKTIDDTYSLMNFKNLAVITEWFEKAHTCYCYGFGISGIIIKDFQQKIERIGYNSRYESDPHNMINSLANIKENDIFLIVSYSGDKKIINKMALFAKQMKAKVVAVAGVHQNELTKIVDITIQVPVKEPEMRIAAINSRLSCMAALDILYFSLVKNQPENVEKMIQATHELGTIINQ